MAFTIQTSREIFTSDEIKLLERYGLEFERLMKGTRLPATSAQERFIKVCRNEVDPQSDYEIVWCKYLQRLNWESDPANQRAMGPPLKAAEGFGGSREASKEMRRAEWADFLKRIKE